jgi:hypothetical protein
MSYAGLAIVAAVVAILTAKLWFSLRDFKRAEYIQTFQWPAGLLQKLETQYPQFSRKESALVGNGLRQFFMAYLKSGRLHVAMPSQVADDLWHEFILYTRAYEEFCAKAFGGFLHHTPAVVLAPEAKRSNEGLRRVWWQCCKLENIDTVNPTRLPLLFALDGKLKIPNGYVYAPDCRDLRRNGDGGSQCGGDFSSSSTDGGTDGFGDGSSGGDGGGDGGGGCGGD